MTDRELHELIGLKKYEQPDEAYFDDFLIEFQQRQRAEMLKTTARGLLIERVRAWFTEFGSLRWVMGAGAAYAAVSLVFFLLPDQSEDTMLTSTAVQSVKDDAVIFSEESIEEVNVDQGATVSMEIIEPVDFSEPAPLFAADERIF